MYTLYTTPESANGRKAVALSRQLGLEPEMMPVNVYRGEGRAPEFLAINPWGTVPTLVDGELVLWESNAILQYISEAYGDAQLGSREPAVRAMISRWLFWETSRWQPALISVLAPHAGHVMVPEHVGRPEHEPRWDAAELRPLLQHLEQHLGGQHYLVGDEVSIADFSVAAMTIFFRRLGFPFDEYPALADWYGRVHGLPGWRAVNVEPWVA